ncbi:MAG: hypothetical protein HY676_06280 [Chloroflexi bacterium]|nr:hypothetical protein [Chloroflexota bacterium]
MRITWKWGIGLGATLATAAFLAGTAVGVVGAQSPGETPTPILTTTPVAGHCPYTDEEMAAHMKDMSSHMQSMGMDMEDMDSHMGDMGSHMQDMSMDMEDMDSHMQGGMGDMMGNGPHGSNGAGTQQGGIGGGMMGGGMMGGGMMGR